MLAPVVVVVLLLLILPVHTVPPRWWTRGGRTWNKAQGFMLGGLRSAETRLERQACVTETGRRPGVVDWVDWRVWGWRSNVLGTRLEFGRRSAGRRLTAFD